MQYLQAADSIKSSEYFRRFCVLTKSAFMVNLLSQMFFSASQKGFINRWELCPFFLCCRKSMTCWRRVGMRRAPRSRVSSLTRRCLTSLPALSSSEVNTSKQSNKPTSEGAHRYLVHTLLWAELERVTVGRSSSYLNANKRKGRRDWQFWNLFGSCVCLPFFPLRFGHDGTCLFLDK